MLRAVPLTLNRRLEIARIQIRQLRPRNFFHLLFRNLPDLGLVRFPEPLAMPAARYGEPRRVGLHHERESAIVVDRDDHRIINLPDPCRKSCHEVLAEYP